MHEAEANAVSNKDYVEAAQQGRLLARGLQNLKDMRTDIKFFLTMAPENVDLHPMLESDSDDQEDRGEQDQDVPVHPSGMFMFH